MISRASQNVDDFGPFSTIPSESAEAYIWGYPSISSPDASDEDHSSRLVALYAWNSHSTTSFKTELPLNISAIDIENESGYGRMIPAYGLPRLLVTLIVLGVIILSAIIGNVFVIAAVVLEKNLHNVANYLVSSLAGADLMVATLVMPLAALNEVSERWFLGGPVCDMWVTFDVICCTASILHLVAISIDRYWAVTRVAYIHNRSAKKILFMVAVSWLLAVSISVPPLFLKSADFDPNATGECMINQNRFYQTFSTICAFFVPFIAVMIIYLKVFLAARDRIRKKRFKISKRQGRDVRGANSRSDETMAIALDGPSNISNPTPTDASAMVGYAETYVYSPVAAEPIDQSLKLLTRNLSGSAEALNDVAVCNGSSSHKVEIESKSSGSPGSASINPIKSDQKPTKLCIPVEQHASGNELTLHKANPPTSLSLRGSFLDLTKQYREKRPPKSASPKTKERRSKEKLEQKRERKAARTLAIITGSFCICWLPFFLVAITRPFCEESCHFPVLLLSIINWLGYLNSLLNPIIYTVFNPDFRLAFRKILFGKYRRQDYRRART